jgi:hypothetical protein
MRDGQKQKRWKCTFPEMSQSLGAQAQAPNDGDVHMIVCWKEEVAVDQARVHLQLFSEGNPGLQLRHMLPVITRGTTVRSGETSCVLLT